MLPFRWKFLVGLINGISIRETMSLIVVSESRLNSSVIQVVRFGATCELDNDNPYGYVPEFCYELPVLSPQVLIDPERTGTENETKTDDLDAETARYPPCLRSSRRFVHTTVYGAPWYQLRWMAYRYRRKKQVSLRFTEFAELSDGRRAVIRNDRGTGWSSRRSSDLWRGTTRRSLVDDVQYSLAQYEDLRPYCPDWIVEVLAYLYEIDVSPASVQTALQAPRHVELGPGVLQQLQH